MSVMCSVCFRRGHNRRSHGVAPLAAGGGKSPTYKSAWSKAMRRRAVMLGRCVDCGEDLKDDRQARCRSCADEQNERHRGLRNARQRYRAALEQIRALCSDNRIAEIIDDALGDGVSRETNVTIEQKGA